MEKRAVVALVLSFVVFVVFMMIGQRTRQVPPPQAPATAPAPTAEKAPAPVPPAPVAAAPQAPPAKAPAPSRPARDVVVDTPLYKAVFTEAGARLRSFELKKYRENLPFTPIWEGHIGPIAGRIGPFGVVVERYQNPKIAPPKPKNLVRVLESQELPLGVSWQGQGLSVPASLPYEASQTRLTVNPGETGTLRFTGVSPEGLAFTKTFKFKADSYYSDLDVQVANRTSRPLDGSLDLAMDADYTGEEASRYNYLGFKGSVNNKMEDAAFGTIDKPKVFTGKVDWAGLDESYFLSAIVPLAAPKATLSVSETKPGPMTVALRNPESLAPGQQSKLSFALYFGPADLTALGEQNLGLTRVVNFGWFEFISKPSLAFLKWLHGYVGNYGWAIVILTLLFRLLFFYPNHKSYKSMKEMQKLQPKVAKLREKYKDDRETMNKELMALYRTFKVNPMAGCLPMVLQLPVFIALYNVLGYAIELRHASFIPTLPFTNIVWLADLSAKDPLLITPIVMGATMFIQQKMTPSAGDPTQAKMMMFLPLIFTFLFLNFASGLVIYWLVNNVLSIAQQYYTNKYLT